MILYDLAHTKTMEKNHYEYTMRKQNVLIFILLCTTNNDLI